MPAIAYLVYAEGLPNQATASRLVADALPPPRPPAHPMVIAAPMPGAPDADLAQEAAWPGWRDHWPRHRGHIILTSMRGGDGFEALCDNAESVLRAAAALVRSTPVMAVGWSANLLYHPAAAFMAAVERGMPTVDVLVRCRWRGRGATTTALTEGLAYFGLPEFDHLPTGEGPDAIYQRLMNLCFYVLQDGKVLGDGDTFGVTATAQMRVRHRRDGDALVLELGAA
jgi:hypothetical protein